MGPSAFPPWAPGTAQSPTNGTLTLPTMGSWPPLPEGHQDTSAEITALSWALHPNPELAVQTLWRLALPGLCLTLIAHPQNLGVLGGEMDLPTIPLPWT